MRLGPYEIVAPLGAGGMGEVYRAKDTRLGRDVAVKVLPEHLSSEPEVRARFEREARAVSSLNHPHICTLHDVGREGDTDYLVMELVDGETLGARLERGALPTSEVLRLGAQIADALDRAHRAGIVHRDLKPANVMLTKSGAKLMDFGLARAGGVMGAGSGTSVTLAALSQSPTMSRPLTVEGTIVGTFQYMAPEQLEGRDADARTDLWALGCVLYEMATGKRAFGAKSQASLIGAIMHAEPEAVSQIAPAAPLGLDRLVSALLAKDPDERVQTAHDVQLQLRWIAEGGSSASGLSAAPAGAVMRRAPRREWVAWAIAALGVLAAGATLVVSRDRAESPVIRAIVPEPANALFLFFGDNAGPPVLSPDGKRLAFVAVDNERGSRLWVRDVSSLAARPVDGTERATYPFWSWDGQSLAFFADQKLKRVDVATGQVITICDAPAGRGGTWSKSGEIVFSPDIQIGLSRVRGMGGASTPVTTCDSTRHTTHRWPHFLPDGEHFLYYAGDHRDVRGRQNAVWIGSLDGRENRELLPCATEALFAEGHLFFVLDSVLVARSFDARARRFTGDVVATAERVQFDPTTWKANLSVSQAGLLAYQPIGGKQGSEIQLCDREGHRLKKAGESGNHFNLALAPDAKRVVYSSQLGPNGDLLVYDFDLEVTRRLTLSEEDEDLPALSPDGRTFAYTVRRSNATHYAIQTMSLDGGGVPRTLFQHARDVWPLDWSSDGRRLLIGIGSVSALTADTLAVLTLDGSEPVAIHAEAAGNIGNACFSNDGRWAAYSIVGGSDPQVFIEPVPGAAPSAEFEGAGRVQVSSRGGAAPCWRADDRELYYARPDGAIVAVPLAPGTMQPGRETALFRTIVRPGVRSLDVSLDGQRFAINTLASEGASPIVLVSGWNRELKSR